MLGTFEMEEQKTEWISTGKAAAILAVSTQAVRDFIKQGQLKRVIDLGTDDRARLYVDKSEVETLAAERKNSSD
jgi:hypothetical protein